MENKQGKKRRLITLLFSTLLLLGGTIQATTSVYTANILSKGQISLTVNNVEKKVETGDVIALKVGDKVCFLKGGIGYITIEGGKTPLSLSYKKPNCKILPKIENIATKLALPKLKKSEPSSMGLRNNEDTYTYPLYPDKNGNLSIESKNWLTSPSRLPIVLQIIDPEGKKVESFESNTQGFTYFILPEILLTDKNGYTLKVSNQRGEVMIESVFYLKKITKEKK